eukprot:765007-Hanusia_phi.AAC.2
MDTRVIIVNQLVQLLSPARRKELAEKHGISEEAVKSVCLAQIDSRMQMQKKYLDQVTAY